jgi:glyoxylase-like metal-dependent hydrolase (beta-lactamase superfamily II)
MTSDRPSVPGLYELGDGVFNFVITGPIQLNAGILVGRDAVAVIDTGTTEDDARSLLAAVASVTGLPVRYVINTHYHGDHSFGNWWFLPAVVVGHARCRLQLVGAEGISHRELMASHLPMVREQVRAVPLAAPTLTFMNNCDVHLGDLDLRLAYLGRGHTDNDIAIGIEGADVVFAGDLIESSGPPVASESFPAEWGATLRKLGAPMVDRYVPGHGNAVDTMFVSRQAQAFETLATTCAEAGNAADAMHAIPQSVFDVLDFQTAAAVKRYFETAGG